MGALKSRVLGQLCGQELGLRVSVLEIRAGGSGSWLGNMGSALGLGVILGVKGPGSGCGVEALGLESRSRSRAQARVGAWGWGLG